MSAEIYALATGASFTAAIGAAWYRTRKLAELSNSYRKILPTRPEFDPDSLDRVLKGIDLSDDMLKKIVPGFEEASYYTPTQSTQLALRLRASYNEDFIAGPADHTETRIRADLKGAFQDSLSGMRQAFRDLDRERTYRHIAGTFHVLTCANLKGDLKPTPREGLDALRECSNQLAVGKWSALLDFHRRFAQVGYSEPLVDYSFDTLGLLAYMLEYDACLTRSELESFARDVAPYVSGLSDALRPVEPLLTAYNLDSYFAIGAKYAG